MPTLFDEPLQFRNFGGYVRDYQGDAVRTCQQHFADGSKGSLVRLPTGTGKTATACMLIDLWLQESRDHQVIVFAHERQLVLQFAEEIQSFLGFIPGIEMGDRAVHPEYMPRVTVVSRATVLERAVFAEETDQAEITSRLYKFDASKPTLVIFDEAHRYGPHLKSCAHLFSYFEEGNPHSRRVGLTATPMRSDKVSLRGVFPDIACDYRLYDPKGGPCAVRDGYAVPFDQRFITVENVDFTNLRTVAGDFEQDELDEVLNTKDQLARLCDPMLELVGNRKTLIFNVTVNMARNVMHYINAELKERGDPRYKGDDRPPAVSLDGSSDEDERTQAYSLFSRGNYQFLSVCGLCREGFNEPNISAVVSFRPTKSQVLWEQQKGRGCRPLRGAIDGLSTAQERLDAIGGSEYSDCLIVDLVGVTGLADTATAAALLTRGHDEVVDREIVQRANELLLEGVSPEDAAERSKSEVEQARADKKARQDAERELEQARAERRAKIKTETTFVQTHVEQGSGGSAEIRYLGHKEPATENQKRYLRANGIPYDPATLSKGQGSRIIMQHRSGMNVNQIRYRNRLPRYCMEQSTPGQRDRMRTLGIAFEEGINFGYAAHLIDQHGKEAARVSQQSQRRDAAKAENNPETTEDVNSQLSLFDVRPPKE